MPSDLHFEWSMAERSCGRLRTLWRQLDRVDDVRQRNSKALDGGLSVTLCVQKRRNTGDQPPPQSEIRTTSLSDTTNKQAGQAATWPDRHLADRG
jgi:hypothetical protein